MRARDKIEAKLAELEKAAEKRSGVARVELGQLDREIVAERNAPTQAVVTPYEARLLAQALRWALGLVVLAIAVGCDPAPVDYPRADGAAFVRDLRPAAPVDGGAAVDLLPVPGPDLSPSADLGPGPDLAQAPDLSPTPDLAPTPDLTPPPPPADLTPPPDLTPAPDLIPACFAPQHACGGAGECCAGLGCWATPFGQRCCQRAAGPGFGDPCRDGSDCCPNATRVVACVAGRCEVL